MNNQPFDIKSLHTAYKNGISTDSIIEECYRRIETINDPGIFIHLIDAAEVKKSARELGSFNPAEKPLWGLPFVIKDNIDAKGLPTTAACPAYSYIPEEDAFVVELLKAAGAILLGKTNLDQFATGLVGVRSPYTPPQNAISSDLIPGGSSSGSAVAVSHGIATFSLGTDTAGSGRVPAALNNIVGFKPSLGAISNTGVVPACRTLDTVSIFALTVEDAFNIFQVCAVKDSRDPYSTGSQPAKLSQPPASLRIGVPSTGTRIFFEDDLQAGAYEKTLASIKESGHAIIDLDFTPFYDVAALLYGGCWVAERYSVIEDLLQTDPEQILPITRQIIEQAENIGASSAFRDFYQLKELQAKISGLLTQIDILCVPSIPTFYTVSDLEQDPLTPNSKLGTYTNFVNLLGLCGVTVPVYPRSDSKPGSVTILAPAGQDNLTASFGHTLQYKCAALLGATNWQLPEMSCFETDALPSEIALALVGAHMSGLPLNREITENGGRFLRSAKTAPNYHLYRLSGGPPFRPGLVSADSGESIKLEIWALPTKNFGEFMRGIPSPLGIGTVMLENDEEVKGFICEPQGLNGAEDITAYGGWRNYLESNNK